MIRNVDELVKELCEAFEKVKNDKSYVSQATCIANIGGKIISTQKVQLEYAMLRKEPPKIEFLDPSSIGKAIK